MGVKDGILDVLVDIDMVPWGGRTEKGRRDLQTIGTALWPMFWAMCSSMLWNGYGMIITFIIQAPGFESGLDVRVDIDMVPWGRRTEKGRRDLQTIGMALWPMFWPMCSSMLWNGYGMIITFIIQVPEFESGLDVRVDIDMVPWGVGGLKRDLQAIGMALRPMFWTYVLFNAME